MSEYNGWSNYATWRINLEVLDGSDDLWKGYKSLYDLANAMKEHVEEILLESGEGLVLDYALAFISDVNWREIANHYYEEEEEAEV